MLLFMLENLIESLINLNDLLINNLIYSLAILIGLNMILCIIEAFLFFVLLKVACHFVKLKSKLKFRHPTNESKQFTVGFFHPFCNSGGGGERVLWSAVKAIQQT